MLNIRKCLIAASPLRNCVFFSSASAKPKRPSRREGSRRIKRFDPQKAIGRNPGVQGQLSALTMDERELSDPDILENMEKQFWNVDKVQDQLDKEDHIHKELLEIFQIQRKQLKEEKMPNMLLWDEKQEIKTLHATDPEKWTIMKLAFSYPATPIIIKKVLRSRWKMRTQEEIEGHDNRVRKNWEDLSNGTLHIPHEYLRKHIQTFTNRTKLTQSLSQENCLPAAKDYNPLDNILKDGGVFGNIYNSYKNLKQNRNTSHSKIEDHIENNEPATSGDEDSIEAGLKKLYHPPEHGTFIIPKSAQNVRLRTTEPTTLEAMKDTVLRDAIRGKQLGKDERSFVQDRLAKEIERKNFEILKDPIGTMPETENLQNQTDKKIDYSPNANNVESRTIYNNDAACHSTKFRGPSVKDSESLEENFAKDSFMGSASKFVNVKEISSNQEEEDRELRVGLKTAEIQRNNVSNEAIVQGVRDYVMTSSESYPLEISIPKDLWKKGKLYRVKDRFYTDDGDFLYRVPGLCK